MPRFFTLDEAQRALASLAPEIGRALSLRSDMRAAEDELQSFSRKVTMSGGMMVDRERIAAVRRTRDEVVDRLRAVIETIQDAGCLIKDLDTGLLDFPTLYRGREVYLCWHAGESSIEYWHEIEAGFRGRKPIDQDFLDNHRGGEE